MQVGTDCGASQQSFSLPFLVMLVGIPLLFILSLNQVTHAHQLSESGTNAAGQRNQEAPPGVTAEELRTSQDVLTEAETEQWKSVSSGSLHTCGIGTDGSVLCWGDDHHRKLDAPSGAFRAIAAGFSHTCGVEMGGSVVCWGSDSYGQVDAPAGSFVSVSAGWGHSCGVRTDGNVACWGSDGSGQASPSEGSFMSVSAFTCGGDGWVGWLGEIRTVRWMLPGVSCRRSWRTWDSVGEWVRDAPAGSFVSVSAGWGHSCGVRADGSVACWGRDRSGQSSPPEGVAHVRDRDGWVCCLLGQQSVRSGGCSGG